MFQQGLTLGKPIEDRPYDAAANDYRAHFSLGMLYLQAAGGVMQSASTTAPGSTITTAQAQQQYSQSAITEFLETLRLKPEVIDAYDSLGIAYAQLGVYDQAVAMWERAIQLSPNYPNPYLRLAQYYGNVLHDMQRANYYFSRYQQLSQGAMPVMPQRTLLKKK
jgi:tetratricopeptide (TPR) repeat protein